MIEILVLLVFITCAFFLNKEYAFLGVLVILPFHFLLKAVLNIVGTSYIFASWKELVIIILFVRVLVDFSMKKNRLNEYFSIVSVLLFILFSTILFILSPNKSDALVSFKNFTFPLMCFFVASHLKFKKINQFVFFKYVAYSTFLVIAVSHLQHYILKYQFAQLMGAIDTIMDNGEIVYKQSAAKIMGKERMYGCFVGPNELGLYLSLILVLSLSFCTNLKGMTSFKVIAIVLLLCSLITLIQTYSRVSISVGFTACLCFFVFIEKKIKITLLVIILSFMLISIMFFILPEAEEIIMASITMKEASAGDRLGQFFRGVGYISKEPLGYGLGTIQYNSSLPRAWPTEIFWWLLFGEMGIVFGGILFYIYIQTVLTLFKAKIESNIFLKIMPVYLSVIMVAGFASVILFEPIFQVLLWSFLGLSVNKTISTIKHV